MPRYMRTYGRSSYDGRSYPGLGRRAPSKAYSWLDYQVSGINMEGIDGEVVYVSPTHPDGTAHHYPIGVDGQNATSETNPAYTGHCGHPIYLKVMSANNPLDPEEGSGNVGIPRDQLGMSREMNGMYKMSQLYKMMHVHKSYITARITSTKDCPPVWIGLSRQYAASGATAHNVMGADYPQPHRVDLAKHAKEWKLRLLPPGSTIYLKQTFNSEKSTPLNGFHALTNGPTTEMFYCLGAFLAGRSNSGVRAVVDGSGNLVSPATNGPSVFEGQLTFEISLHMKALFTEPVPLHLEQGDNDPNDLDGKVTVTGQH